MSDCFTLVHQGKTCQCSAEKCELPVCVHALHRAGISISADGHAFGHSRCNICVWGSCSSCHVTIMRQCWAAKGAGMSCLKDNSPSVKAHDFGLSICRKCTTINMGCSYCKGKAFTAWLTNGNTLSLCVHHIYTVPSNSRLVVQELHAKSRLQLICQHSLLVTLTSV